MLLFVTFYLQHCPFLSCLALPSSLLLWLLARRNMCNYTTQYPHNVLTLQSHMYSVCVYMQGGLYILQINGLHTVQDFYTVAFHDAYILLHMSSLLCPVFVLFIVLFTVGQKEKEKTPTVHYFIVAQIKTIYYYEVQMQMVITMLQLVGIELNESSKRNFSDFINVLKQIAGKTAGNDGCIE